MKAKFTLSDHGTTVTVEHDGMPYSGEPARVTDEYTVPTSGGYVRDEHGQQVCELLSNRGNTLMSEPGQPFIDLIRTEWRRAARIEARRLAKSYY